MCDPNLSIATSADREGGVRATEQLLKIGAVPEAIVCYSDAVAVGVMTALRTSWGSARPGRRCRQLRRYPGHRQTTTAADAVATYPDRTGADAAELLLRRIDDHALPPRTVLLTSELHVRESTMNFHAIRKQAGRLAGAQSGAGS